MQLHAVEKDQMIANWKSTTTSVKDGLRTIEKEFVNLKSNNTFNLVMLVSVQKNQSYIKDLRIEASGIWKVHENILVRVIKEISIPTVQDANQISQESIDNLAANFKFKLQNNPIHINTIKFLNQNSLILINEKHIETTYSK
ncbi:hypothetical protein MNB_SV-5-345 [hydrothermal vent metagenome]|uniref:Uncharacterized protein n=1 Tax=hydrothermal vent metagenome TaxID=652676 RepID=A0A1W1EF58_9ZZZZ